MGTVPYFGAHWEDSPWSLESTSGGRGTARSRATAVRRRADLAADRGAGPSGLQTAALPSGSWDRSGSIGRILIAVGFGLALVGMAQGASSTTGSSLVVFGALLGMAGIWLILPGP